MNPADAIVMGIDRIEHFLGGEAIRSDRPAYASLEALDLSDPWTKGAIEDVVALYRRHGVFFDATLTAYGYFAPGVDEGVYAKWIEEMDLLTLGTDHPSWGEFFSGFGVHRELQAWVEAGIPAAVALRAATATGALALGVADRLGTIEPGKYADMTVVRGDPLADIWITREVALVVKAGRTYDPVALLESVRGKLGPESEADAGCWKGSLRFGG